MENRKSSHSSVYIGFWSIAIQFYELNFVCWIKDNVNASFCVDWSLLSSICHTYMGKLYLYSRVTLYNNANKCISKNGKLL